MLHLRRLEIHGFKSFALKQVFHFQPGITAIVGPNGSGKSNVMDAIRWCLGEQNVRTLRGSRMDDLLFGGTRNRRPLAFAEVSMIFDNSDGYLATEFNEVVVTRRLTRDGESEYLLNGVTCRLKDLTDVFSDTGFGKQAYSIISQGKIDEVLNLDPLARRSIFEEACGVVRYKTKRAEAEKKLSQSEIELTILRDSIGQLEEGLKPLKAQADNAREYTRLQTRLSMVEAGVLLSEAERLNSQLNDLGLQEKLLRSSREILENDVQSTLNDMERLRETIFGLKEKVHGFERERGETLDRKSHAWRKLDALKARTEQLEASWLQINEEADKVSAETLNLKAEMVEVERLASESHKTVESLETELVAVERRLDERTKVEKDLSARESSLNSQWLGCISAMTLQKERLSKIANEAELLQKTLASIVSRKSEIGSTIEEMQRRLADLNSMACEAANTVASLKAKRESLAQRLQELAASSQAAGIRFSEASQRIERLSARHSVLRDAVNEYDGYYRGPRTILEASRKEPAKFTGIIGAIVELVKVPPKYGKAVEAAFGGALQNIVTEAETDARRAIEYLKKANGGWATFLPLDIIKPPPPVGVEVTKSVSGCVPLVHVLEFNPKVARAIEFLVGRVILAPSMNAMLQIGRLTGFKFKVVDIDGDCLNPGGSMSGGSSRERHGILARTSEITELGKAISEAKKVTESLEREMAGIETERLSVQRAITSIESDIKDREMTHARATSEMQVVSESLRRYSAESLRLSQEEIQLKQKLDEFSSTMDLADHDAVPSQEHSESVKGQISLIQDQLKEVREEKEVLARQAAELRQNYTAASVRAASYEERLRALKQRLEQAADALEEKVQRRASIEESINSARTEMESVESQTARIQSELESLEHRMSAAMKELARVDALLRQGETEVERKKREISAKDHELNTLQIAKTRLEVQLEGIRQSLNSRYGHLLGKTESIPMMEPDKADEEIRFLSERMRGLEPINFNAPKEYDEGMSRLGYLTEQYRDVEGAISSLRILIQDLNSSMRRKFIATFSQIRSAFGEVFVEMFGSGSADLLLCGEDPLEAGVEIRVQPPGRTKSNLSLLSGGERAMTAIALVFSILRVRPSPLCILDEVESGLDEANVLRFARYLKRFSLGTQFILITHQQATMEAADVIHGVTMEEEGVSKVVSVRMVGREIGVSP